METYLEEFKTISEHYITKEEYPKFEILKDTYKKTVNEKLEKYLAEKEIDNHEKLFPTHINEMFQLILEDTQILTILSQHWGLDVFTSTTFYNFHSVYMFILDKFQNYEGFDMFCDMAIHYTYKGKKNVISHQF